MSVSAHEKSFGNFTKRETIVGFKHSQKMQSGSVVEDVVENYNINYMAKNCRRDSHTNNPAKFIEGTGTKWRSPSEYGRWISNYSQKTGYKEEPYKPDGWRNAGESVYLQDFVTPGCPKWPSGIGYPAWDLNLLNQAATECLVKLGDRKLDLGTNLAESVQTFGMVASASEALFRSAIDFKRGNWKQIAIHLGLDGHGGSPSKKFADEFLKWKFGVVPLISDIYGGVELLKQKLKPAQILHAKRVVSDNGEFSEYSNSGCWGTGNWKGSYTVEIWAKLNSASLRFANQANLTDPLTVAWEIVPWSFVIDWCIPVGNVLEGMQATSGLDFVAAYRSYRLEGNANWEVRANSTYTNKSPATVKHDYFSYKREVYPTWPKPFPYVVQPFKIGRATTALSLLRQLL